MELKDQLCNEDLAKELWKKGLRIHVYFNYFINKAKDEVDYDVKDDIHFNDRVDWDAPTGIELGEIIPYEIKGEGEEEGHSYELHFWSSEISFSANYIMEPVPFVNAEHTRLFKNDIEAKTESNLRAKIILRLLKENHCDIAPNGNLNIVD